MGPVPGARGQGPLGGGRLSKTHVDAPALLDEALAQLRRYCVLPSDDAAHAVILWCAATHALPELPFAPRLSVRSGTKRSGKSRVLEIVTTLVHEPLKTVNATPAAIFRSLDADHPRTLVFDEVDTIFGSKKVAEQNEDLRGLLNAGFERGNPSIRCVGPNQVPTEFQSFAMAALAGIGSLPDTIEDRSIIIRMKRRKPSEQVTPYRLMRDRPDLLKLGARLAAWMSRVDVREALRKSEPASPLEDRAADVWEGLLMVADVAGGPWPERARRAAIHLTAESSSDEEEDSPAVRLLHDLRDVFALVHSDFAPTEVVLQYLRSVDQSPWGELTSHRLGRMLKEFGIKSVRNAKGDKRGYRRSQFTDAWERYPVTERGDSGGGGDVDLWDQASEASESGSAPSDQRRHSDASTDALLVPLKASDKVSDEQRRSTTLRTLPDASDASDEDQPCDRCGSAPTRTDRNGSRWCVDHAGHLWRAS